MMRILLVCVAVLLPASQAWLFSFGSGSRQAAVGETNEECLQKAADGDCHFYTCYDERHPCEMNNWALSYGWRFCKRYDQMYSTFTTEGKAWIDNTRQCTMRAMIEFYNDTHVNCKDVEAAMHEAYGKCSKDNGICNAGMVMDNKESLLEIHTFSRHSLVRFLSYIRECSGDELDEFTDWARRQRDIVRPYLESLSDLLSDLAERDWSLPDLPDFQIPDIPEFNWPSFGVRWTEADASDESSESKEEVKVKVIGDK